MKNIYQKAMDDIKISEDFIIKTAEKMKTARDEPKKNKINVIKYSSIAAGVAVITLIAVGVYNNGLNFNSLGIKMEDSYSTGEVTINQFDAGENKAEQTTDINKKNHSESEITDETFAVKETQKINMPANSEQQITSGVQEDHIVNGIVDEKTENEVIQHETVKKSADITKYLDTDFEAIYPLTDNRFALMASDPNKYGNVEVWLGTPKHEAFAQAIQKFSANSAYEVLTSTDGNVNYSPLSLYCALSLLATGAEGINKQEIMSALQMSDIDIKTMSEQTYNLYRNTYMDDENGILSLFNSLWFNKANQYSENIRFSDSFVDNAQNFYFTSVFREDFSKPDADKKMSNWVSKNTNGKLNPTFDHTPNYQDFILSIVNTIYYKCKWYDPNQFLPENNTFAEFHVSKDKSVECEYMNDVSGGAYYNGSNYKITYLNLANGAIALCLPDEGTDIRSVMSENKDIVQKMNTISQNRKLIDAVVTLKFPKFNFNSNLKLEDTLKKLGISEAFKDNSDIVKFSGITKDVPLSIGNVEQGSFIGVDENGIEAAAYTEIDLRAGGGRIDEKITLNFDRPFIYSIIDKNGIPLFTGIVENPKED